MTAEFNLSERRIQARAVIPNDLSIILVEDVKKFIKLVKKEIRMYLMDERMERRIIDNISKLAGEKLT